MYCDPRRHESLVFGVAVRPETQGSGKYPPVQPGVATCGVRSLIGLTKILGGNKAESCVTRVWLKLLEALAKLGQQTGFHSDRSQSPIWN